MPRRRRVYVIRIEDLLADDPAPPSRLKPILRAAAYAAAIMAVGFLLVQLIVVLFPDHTAQAALPALIGYALILLLFFALAKQINHVE